MSPKSDATDTTTGSDSAPTEHADEPQLAELVNQEAGLSSAIELKVIRNEIIDYTYSFNGNQVSTQKVQVILQSKIPNQYCLGVAKLQRKDKSELRKLPIAGRLAPRGGSKPSHSSMTSQLIFTPHAASQSICASRRLRRCYRARRFHRHQCQLLLSQTYCN